MKDIKTLCFEKNWECQRKSYNVKELYIYYISKLQTTMFVYSHDYYVTS